MTALRNEKTDNISVKLGGSLTADTQCSNSDNFRVENQFPWLGNFAKAYIPVILYVTR